MRAASLVTFTLVLALAACGKSDGDGSGNGGGGAAPAGATKIGAVLPLSGATATYGEETLGGLKLAIDEINAMDGPKLDLTYKDTKGDSTETAKLVGQLIQVDGVKAIIGEIASTNTLKGAKVAQESGIPMITPGSTNVEVTKKGDYISRVCFIDPVQGAVLARLALNDLKKTRAAIVVDKASDYSVGLADAFKKTFTAGGGAIVGEETFTAGDSDFSALITKVVSQNPDVILVPAYYGDVGPMLRQAGTQWQGIPVLAGDGIDSPDLLTLMGGYNGDVYMSTHFSADDTAPKVKDFVAKYKAKFGKAPGAMSALGYDAAYALYDAMKRAGTDDPKKVKDAINAIKGLEGVTGTITLDENRNATKDVVILKVKPTGKEFYKRISAE
ncbi:MAG: ABC transporter substrate-binding protein [Myxococcales bacterium]|nr:ABC transporter substrate-binding protein [Myxococcales bacterium]MCB9733251.1 ABC transporter substrate-binding protein [Deltaproteobacteria bacterium]